MCLLYADGYYAITASDKPELSGTKALLGNSTEPFLLIVNDFNFVNISQRYNRVPIGAV